MASNDIANIITGLTILNKYDEVTNQELDFQGSIAVAIRHRVISAEDRELLVAANWFPDIHNENEHEWEAVDYWRDGVGPFYFSWLG
jgi:hypothetical protein